MLDLNLQHLFCHKLLYHLYAIAVLSALIRERKGNFPVVVDTPLARLDKPHRRAIVQRFFSQISHQVIVLCMRYLVEGLDEEQILAIDRGGDVANCGVTTYELNHALEADGALELRAYNFVAPLEVAGAPVTTKRDLPAGAR